MSSLLEDKDAIRDLLSKYCFHTDSGEADALVALFVENCLYDGGPFGRFEDRAALHGFIAGAAARYSSVRHLTMNEVILVAGETARSRSYFLVLNCASNPPAPIFAGTYEDEFVKAGGRWLFKSRIVKPAQK